MGLDTLDAVAQFLGDADARMCLARHDATLQVALPDDGGLLVIEWAPGGVMTVRMPLVQVPATRFADALDLVSDTNSVLGVLGFVLYRATGWVEFRTTIVPDVAGEVPASALGRVVVTVQETAALLADALGELCRDAMPSVPSWWVEA